MLKSTLLTFSVFIFLFACAPLPSITQAQSPKNEYVVLLHGLARHESSMRKMQKALVEQGYGTCNIAYPSRHHSIEKLTQDYVLPKVRECLANKDAKLNFVTHSLGGIIVRNLLQKEKFKNLSAVVMLSPPNQGSEVVDTLGDYWLFELIYGPAGKELGTGKKSTPNRLGPAKFKLGIITGNFSINPIFSLIIPGEDDGKVSIERAKLQGMSDFLVVPVSHPFIMKDNEVIRQTLFFLKHYRFRHNQDGCRDREAPHSAPLPHHRAYGSVHGGSAGQANDSQGNESSSLVPESIP